MSRTYRRTSAQYEYAWVLRDRAQSGIGCSVLLDPRSKAGRKAIAIFHSDAMVTMRSAPPRKYRKTFDHKIRTDNERIFRRWLADPDYEPMFQTKHYHSASWHWW